MNTISMELHQEQVTELQSQIEELESEKLCLDEELEDLKAEYEDLEDKCASYEKANKAANRDFFILAAVYVATLALMIYLFVR